MQSMFRLPWSSEPPGDKIMEKATAFNKSHQVPVVEIMNKLKRKRTDSPDPSSTNNAHAHVMKKWKSANGEVKPAVTENGNAERPPVVDGFVRENEKRVKVEATTPTNVQSHSSGELSKGEGAMKAKALKVQKPSATSPHAASADDNATMADSGTALQQAIEAELNLEILLKHNELRLIEQELAKCQVALEQLRRCQLVPYPGNEALSENVSRGVGPALQPPSGYTEPQFAAPWGVTDGPYTRHYAKWLIQDPKFDSLSENAFASHSQGYFGHVEGRSTRGSFVEYPPSAKSRTSRTSTGTLKLPALGENPAPAPKVDPLLHKRSTDGQWVRLFCAICQHSNFSNTQGFLNHCRIKHNQIFKSHDAAAIACGVPVDPNEVGTQPPNSEPASTTVTTPAAGFPVPTTPGVVHPLIRSNPTQTAKPVHRDFNASTSVTEGNTPNEEKQARGDFEPSPQMPRLNSLLVKRGFTENFKQIVDTARTPVNTDSLDSDDELADSANQTPISANSKSASATQLARLPAGAGTAKKMTSPSKKASSRPGSKKGHMNGNAPRLPVTSLHPSAFSLNDGVDHPMPDSPVDLSPNTVESNPGLVSDHDDDDDEDGDDAHSEPHMGHSEVDFLSDVLVEDASDVERDERTGSRKGLGGCFEKGEGSRKN